MWRSDGLGSDDGAGRWLVATLAATLLVGCGGTTTERTGGGNHEGAGGGSYGSSGATGAGGSGYGAGGSTNGAAGGIFAAGGNFNGQGGALGTGAFGMYCPENVCPVTTCAPGYMLNYAPDACCPTCVSTCGEVICALPKCPAGAGLYTPPGKCCPTCGPDCSLVDCAVPDCAPGFTIVQTPAQCCGTCQPKPGVDAGAATCNPGGLTELLQKRIAEVNGLACMTSSDCQIVSFGYRCLLDCGSAVNTSQAGPLTKATYAYSESNCSGCPITDAACPPVFYTAECLNGQCKRVP